VLTVFDILLIAGAVVVMAAGIRQRWLLVQQGRPARASRNPAGLIRYLFSHDKIRQIRTAGWAHLLVFFGFLVPMVVVIAAQFGFTLPFAVAHLLSLGIELIGLAMLSGLLYLLIRRFGATKSPAPQKTLVPMVLLLFIVVTGFLAEGARLAITVTGFTWSSPLGWLISLALPDSPLLMQVMIRLHFFALLVFVAVLPYGFMRHLFAGSLTVYYRRPGLPGQAALPSGEMEPAGAATIQDFTWKQLLEAEACVSCGRCETNCPAFQAEKPLSPRKVMRDILSQMEQTGQKHPPGAPTVQPMLEDAITADEIWSCTSCMACLTHCPLFIEPLDKIINLRRHKVMGQGKLPVEARGMVRNLELFGDVYGKGISHRRDWALNRAVPVISESSAAVEVLFWVGCAAAFHPRYRQAALMMVEILRAGAVDFAVLGKAEYCCGDPARRLGDDAVFIELAQRNIRHLKRFGARKIVTLCPHCYNTLKHEYAGMGSDFKVEPAGQFIARLIHQNRIQLKYPLEQTITLHDPCFLGRANQIYEPLRQICRAVPGLRIKELQRNREGAFCCGGGGGRMWLHDGQGQRINLLRAEEIVRSGAPMVATACPYCITMLEDGIASLEIEKPPKVKDIVEIAASALAEPDKTQHATRNS